jgi:hypothetical protein
MKQYIYKEIIRCLLLLKGKVFWFVNFLGRQKDIL